jgi:chromosome partitioning protein
VQPGEIAVGVILTIASSKGGGGKTLAASLLAPGLAARGYQVGVIDADPNGSFAAWHATYSGPPLRCQAEARDVEVVDLAQAWAQELDVVVIDTAGFGNLTAAAAMGCADHVLIPCMADRGSTREAAKTVGKVASLARAARRDIGASIVLSQWRRGGVAEQAALADLSDFGATNILKTSIPDRAAFRKMSFDGQAVTGMLGLIAGYMIDELAALARLAKQPKLAKRAKPAKKER